MPSPETMAQREARISALRSRAGDLLRKSVILTLSLAVTETCADCVANDSQYKRADLSSTVRVVLTDRNWARAERTSTVVFTATAPLAIDWSVATIS